MSADEYAAAVRDMEELVSRSHLFKTLDGDGRREVLSSAYVTTFEQGDTLIRQGEPGDVMFLVLSGRVHIKTAAASGEVHLAELGRGACVGEVAVLTGQPRTATVTALTPIEAAVLRKNRIERILDDHPTVRELLLSLVEHRARDTVGKLLG